MTGYGGELRCSDYRLLDLPVVREALTTAPQRLVQEETGTTRDVYDVGWISWTSEVDAQAVITRLIVTCTHLSGAEEPKVGKRRGDRLYELFVTDRTAEALTAPDVLSLYFARGGFEQTLSEEDVELDPDRWFSGHPHGQELAQILAQWVWNMRLQLGLVTAPSAPRITLWSEALTVAETASNTVAPTADTTEMPAKARSEASAAPTPATTQSRDTRVSEPIAERDGFVLQSDGTLRCPENKTLRRSESRRDRVRFIARDSDCRSCSRATQCLGKRASGLRGRRIDWPATGLAPSAPKRAHPEPTCIAPPHLTQRAASLRFTPPPYAGPEPLDWHDLPATALRRRLPSVLRQQRIDWQMTDPPSSSRMPTIIDRDRRAHRRLTWRDRLARNARPNDAPSPHLHLHGIPVRLATYLGIRAAG